MRTLIKKANITAADKVARKSDWAWALEQGTYRNGQTYYAVVLYSPNVRGVVHHETTDLDKAKVLANTEWLASVAHERRSR